MTTQAPAAEFLSAFCSALGVNGDWLLTGRGPMKASDVKHHALGEARAGDLLGAMAGSIEVLIDRVDRTEKYVQTLETRVRGGGGTGGHNGLADIQQALGTNAYPRVRIGIGASPSFMDQADYVLGRFTDFEMTAIAPAIDRAADAVETFVGEGIDAAMNKHNTTASDDENNKNDENDAAPPGWLSTEN